MATVQKRESNETIRDVGEITAFLRPFAIDYERWENLDPVSADATDEDILNAYSEAIESLKSAGGYLTADVINVGPETPGLSEMLNKFNKEHWHDEDEVRFIVKGHGLFHIAPPNGEVFSIKMEAGDLIRVPRGTLHWFDLCGDRTVRAIRLFKDVSGWTPHYTGSGNDASYEPLCFGETYFPGFEHEYMMDVILLDIEGTTTPIDFVHKTLFPFSKIRIGDFVRDNFVSIRREIDQLATEHAADGHYADQLDVDSAESVGAFLRYLIEADRKSTPLKTIQGKIWQGGYESGELLSKVFTDVPPALEQWKTEGKNMAIYSSGSILAQKLLFRYTDHGDLTPFIGAYFDTHIGGKRESTSYTKIAEEVGSVPAKVLFISDIIEELNAAHCAGMRTQLIIRPGNALFAEPPGFKSIRSFEEISLFN
ncbi:MAG: acireductone synthase [Pyrinomonadaceae bacterium]